MVQDKSFKKFVDVYAKDQDKWFEECVTVSALHPISS